MNDLTAEEPLIPLAEVPKLAFIPRRRGGRKLHVSCVHRWVRNGVRGVRLEAVRVGGTLCTTVSRLQAFFQRLAGTPVQSCGQPNNRQEHDGRIVDRELDEEGF